MDNLISEMFKMYLFCFCHVFVIERRTFSTVRKLPGCQITKRVKILKLLTMPEIYDRHDNN